MARSALPLSLSFWTRPPHDGHRRWSRLVDREHLREALFEILGAHAAPLVYEVFGETLVMGDSDITIEIGEAEWDSFYVGQRERGALSEVSFHASAERAVTDFLIRAIGPDGAVLALAPRLVRRHPLGAATH